MEGSKLKRVVLDGDALIFRVMEDGFYADRVFVRDPSQPTGNNCWMQIANYRTFVETYETTSYCPKCSKKWLDHNHSAADPCAHNAELRGAKPIGEASRSNDVLAAEDK